MPAGQWFCRFAGCNLWNGREKDRLNAVCKFCDTDFIGTDGENGVNTQLQNYLRKLSVCGHRIVRTSGSGLHRR